jgi:hypothetical protein
MTGQHDVPPIPPRTLPDFLKDYWPFITGVVVAGWVAFTWLTDQRKVAEDRRAEAERQAQVRLFEARKPFNDIQLSRYLETARVVGLLVTTTDVKSAEWETNFRRYEQLFWTELSMVEDDGVKSAMQEFAGKLRSINANKPGAIDADFEGLKQAPYRLALALRQGVQKTWVVDLSGSSTK